MPPIFVSENVIAVTVKFTWMIHTSFEIMRILFHRVCAVFNTLLPTLNKTLYTSVVKFPASTSEHITKLSYYFHLQNGLHIVHLLEGQTGGSQKVPELGCEQDGEEQFIPFLGFPHRCAS
jgi:hypothetical protein